MTELAKPKQLAQVTIAELHQKMNMYIIGKDSVPVSELAGTLAMTNNDIMNKISNTQNKKLIKTAFRGIIKKIIKTAKDVAVGGIVNAKPFFNAYYGGNPLRFESSEHHTFDLVIERKVDDSILVIFGQNIDDDIDAAAILGEGEHALGVQCSEVVSLYSVDFETVDVVTFDAKRYFGNENLTNSSSHGDIGSVMFDKSHKYKMFADSSKDELWGKIQNEFAETISVNDYVTLYSRVDPHIVIARVSSIQTHQGHSKTDFNSMSFLSTEVKLVPIKEKSGKDLKPISNKQFQGFNIRFCTDEETLLISGMDPAHSIPFGNITLANGDVTTAWFPYDPNLSSLDKTFYLSKLYFGNQGFGKTNALAMDIRAMTTCQKIPLDKRPSVIILDGEDSFIDFPRIDQMTEDTQFYMKEYGYGDINHQVFTVSDDPNVGNATLSFEQLDVKSWYLMLPNLAAKTEGMLIQILKSTLEWLKKENLQISVENIRRVAMKIAESSNLIHRMQLPSIARALESPELDLFSDSKLKTVLDTKVLFKPGQVTTINVSGLDNNRRRIVALYLLEMIQKNKVINNTRNNKIICAFDEC